MGDAALSLLAKRQERGRYRATHLLVVQRERLSCADADARSLTRSRCAAARLTIVLLGPGGAAVFAAQARFAGAPKSAPENRPESLTSFRATNQKCEDQRQTPCKCRRT